MTGKRLEPPFGLDIDFGEALERFTRTKPGEVAASVERSKQKKPPGAEPPGGLETPRSEPGADRKRKPRPG
jgi:hypothetical protein